MCLPLPLSLTTASQIFILQNSWQLAEEELQYDNLRWAESVKNDHIVWPQLPYKKLSAPLMLDHIKWERILRPHIWPLSEPDYPEAVAHSGLCINFFGQKSTHWTIYHAKKYTPLLGVIETTSSSVFWAFNCYPKYFRTDAKRLNLLSDGFNQTS
jgi:hypothetical protein